MKHYKSRITNLGFVMRLLLFCGLLQGNTLSAQKAGLDDWGFYRDTLLQLEDSLFYGTSDSVRLESSRLLKSNLRDFLLFENAQDYDWTAFQFVLKKTNQSQDFFLYNWALRRDNGDFEFVAILKYKWQDQWKVVVCEDRSKGMKSPQTQTLSPEQWYGALYYEMIEVKQPKRKQSYWLLLGWDGYEFDSNQKLIDCMYLDEQGDVKFGLPIFEIGEETLSRFLHRYKEDAVVTLRYDEDNQRIVFDHLEPMEPRMEGMRQFYISDFTYDAFNHRKGRWRYATNVDVRNPDNGVKRHKKIDNRLFKESR